MRVIWIKTSAQITNQEGDAPPNDYQDVDANKELKATRQTAHLSSDVGHHRNGGKV